MPEKEVGRVIHYFNKIGVAIVRVSSGKLSIGDSIHIEGTTTDFSQPVKSIQIDGESVERASKGKEVGIKVKKQARQNDVVSLVS